MAFAECTNIRGGQVIKGQLCWPAGLGEGPDRVGPVGRKWVTDLSVR